MDHYRRRQGLAAKLVLLLLFERSFSHALFGRKFLSNQIPSNSRQAMLFLTSYQSGIQHNTQHRNLHKALLSLRAGDDNDGSSNNNEFKIRIDFDPDDEYPVDQAIILMDGFCPYHGGYLTARALEIPGVAVIHVCSNYLSGYFRTTTQEGDFDSDDIPEIPNTPEEAEMWKEQVQEYFRSVCQSPNDVKLRGVYCESDSGLADAEKLKDLLQVDCLDSPVVSEARRNKHIMHETIKNKLQNKKDSRVMTPKQKLCISEEEVAQFAKNELGLSDSFNDDLKIVVKPIRGCASESVYLCSTLTDAKNAWKDITATAVFGSPFEKHSSVLVQEYVRGTEYAVDVVSRNGQHKITAIWKYDKRKTVDTAHFCYFQTKLVDCETDSNARAICDAVHETLDALGVKWGLSHNEFIIRQQEGELSPTAPPVLVEVNCRQHNMDFCPLSMACLGYNALDMTLVAFLGGEEDFNEYPSIPTLRAHGCMVHLVNYQKGILQKVNHLQEIMDLPSVLDLEVYENFQTPGEMIEPTRDIRTDAGWVQLINPDSDELQADFDKIVNKMPTMFDVRPIAD